MSSAIFVGIQKLAETILGVDDTSRDLLRSGQKSRDFPDEIMAGELGVGRLAVITGMEVHLADFG
jgi:hypothetical protein